jgi:hypothetical protein
MRYSLNYARFPKLNSMPRGRSDANTYLTMYQTIVKKEHVQKELQDLEKRTKIAKERLAILDKQISKYPKLPTELKNSTLPKSSQPSVYEKYKSLSIFDNTSITESSNTESKPTFTTMTLKY